MHICYHCGRDISDTFQCERCGQEYCAIHLEPQEHECNLVLKAQIVKSNLNPVFQNQVPLQTYSSQLTPFQCWFCGNYYTETYKCQFCTQDYCEFHFNQEAHDCPSLVEPQIMALKYPQPTPQQDLQEPISIDRQEHTEHYENGVNILPVESLIELNYRPIESNVNKLIQSQIQHLQLSGQSNIFDLNLQKLLVQNPPVFTILNDLYEFEHNKMVEGALYWLGNFENPKAGIEFICQKRGLNAHEITFHKLIKFYYSYLNDASYYKECNGTDTATGEELHDKVVVSGTIQITKKCLSDISEHGRQGGDREISGFLIGKRTPNGSIDYIERYIPLTHGTGKMAFMDGKEIVDVINNLNLNEENLIGFCHSHPYLSVAGYSTFDKNSHVKLAQSVSILKALLESRLRISKDHKIRLSSSVSSFEYSQAKYILNALAKTHSNVILYNRIMKKLSQSVQGLMDFSLGCIQRCLAGEKISLFEHKQEINATFNALKEDIENILKRTNMRERNINFYMLPFAGFVICPWMRTIAIMDCKYEPDPANLDDFISKWFYYRIKII